jgi:hypothetical protein
MTKEEYIQRRSAYLAVCAERDRYGRLTDAYSAGLGDNYLGTNTPEYQIEIWRRFDTVAKRLHHLRCVVAVVRLQLGEDAIAALDTLWGDT